MGISVSMIEDKVYAPSDPEWKTDATVRVIAGGAFGRERFCLAASLSGDAFYEFDNYCRFFRHVDGQWTMSEVGDRIIKFLPYKHSNWSKSGLIAMSWEGQLVFLGDTVWQENISTAGIDRDGAKGYLTFLVEEAGHLWAGGDNGQIYRRARDGTWPTLDAGAFRPFDPSRVNTYSLSTLRVVGREIFSGGMLRFEEGIIYRLNEDEYWRQIETTHNFGAVHDIFDARDGTALVGTRQSAFVLSQDGNLRPLSVVGTVRDVADFGSYVEYKEKVFLVDGFNLLHMEDGKIRKFESYDGSRNWAESLQIFDQYLWVFGNRGAARFDGQDWKYFFPPAFT
jgi:hypothetical protein